MWVGDNDVMPFGSTGKVRLVYQPDETGAPQYRSLIDVDFGGGRERVCRVGDEVVTCRQAANRGIEPWVSVFPPRKPPGVPI